VLAIDSLSAAFTQVSPCISTVFAALYPQSYAQSVMEKEGWPTLSQAGRGKMAIKTWQVGSHSEQVMLSCRLRRPLLSTRSTFMPSGLPATQWLQAFITTITTLVPATHYGKDLIHQHLARISALQNCHRTSVFI
jgi:hypothetical protein